MLTLIQNANLYTPESRGQCDILVAGAEVLSIAPAITLSGEAVNLVDGSGLLVTPGLVDALTHPAGGGGEGGFAQRTGEITASAFVNAGITTPVGALGTDSITRSLEVLYGQVMHLRSQGLAAYMYGGSYRVPVDTLTGDVVRDLVLVEPLIGFGEIAIADHRGTQPSAQELRRLGAETRLGGTISGKGGVVMVHVGEGESRLALIREALAGSDLSDNTFYPTHCNRSAALLEEAFALARQGSAIDLTASTTPEFIAAGEVPVLDALALARKEEVPLERVTVSSDAGGSLPLFDNDRLVSSRAAQPGVLLELLFAAFDADPGLFGDALAAMTRNPADALHLQARGRLEVGSSADLLLLDPAGRQLLGLMCQGRWLLDPRTES